MTNIDSLTWPLEPHTEVKHVILRKYLNVWLPILSIWNSRIVYVDGFSGPGEYLKGEDGSPIIAIKSVSEHRLSLKAEIVMIFIEERKDRCSFLKNKLENTKIPSNISYEVVCGEFRNVISDALDQIEKKGLSLAPTFVFIDPFGFKGISMDVIKRIMNNQKCEVLITFMYEEIDRFLSLPSNEKHITEMFGTEDWKGVPEKGPKERMEFLHSLYFKQLEAFANIKFIRSFKMTNKFNKVDYFLFFGTNSFLGLEKMKDAMWKVDKTGSFEFSDATYSPFQGVLFEERPNFFQLKKIIVEKFKGKEITSKKLGDFIVLKTSFLRSHYKKSILVPMEKANPPEIEIIGGRNRKGTHPDGCIIKFL
jgi:three-Cys-motif partner protein